MVKLLGIAVSVLFCSLLLKDKNKPVAVLLSVSGACLLFFSAAGEVKTVVDGIKRIGNMNAQTASYLKLMLKVLAITLAAQLVSDVCRDNGESALASMTETAVKILVIALVLPVFETIITIVTGLVK